MGISKLTRASSALIMLVAVLALSVVAAGCGDDNKDSGSETGAGAPAGATGNEAGGAAVEAGKQRDPDDVAQEKEAFSDEPPPVQLQSGNESGFTVKKPTAVIVQSNKELNALTKKLYSNGVKKENVPPIDFKSRQAVAVVMPTEPKGTIMQIQDIHEEDSKMQIKIVRLLPGKGCDTGDTKPNPYHLVETRKMQGEPKITAEDVRASPC